MRQIQTNSFISAKFPTGIIKIFDNKNTTAAAVVFEGVDKVDT